VVESRFVRGPLAPLFLPAARMRSTPAPAASQQQQ
jgi:hypothetical protein